MELWNAAAVEALGEPDTGLEEIRSEWATPGFSLDQSSRLVCTAEGKLVGYAEVWDLLEIPVRPRVFGCVHPDFVGQGIGSYLLAWAEARSREVLGRLPESLRVVMQAGAFSEHGPSERLMQDHGLQLVRQYWEMVIELDHVPPAPVWPAGIELRGYHHDADAAGLYSAEDEAFSDHWGYVQETFEVGFERWSHHVFDPARFDPHLWYLAMHGTEIAGAIRCRPESETDPQMGWVSSIFVRKPWRRRGLGLALLLHALRKFQDLGRARVGLGVDAANLTGATGLYQKAGMKPRPRYDLFEKELRAGEELSVR